MNAIQFWNYKIFLSYNSAQDGYETCEFIALPAKYDFGFEAIGLQKNSPYLDVFNYYILQLMEKGAYDQIGKKYGVSSQVCPDYNGKPIGYVNCGVAFIILAVGFILCSVMMLIERSNKRYGCFGSSKLGIEKCDIDQEVFCQVSFHKQYKAFDYCLMKKHNLI